MTRIEGKRGSARSEAKPSGEREAAATPPTGPAETARPRIRRRLRAIAVGLVLLPSLALAFLLQSVWEADEQAQLRDAQERQQALEQRVSDLAGRIGSRDGLFPREPREYFTLLESARPLRLSGPVDIDASCSDWAARSPSVSDPCEDGALAFDRGELLERPDAGYEPGDFSFSIVTGERERQIYVFLRVVDDDVTIRERHLDEGDHLRLVVSLREPAGAAAPARFVVALDPGPGGAVTTYQVERSWRQQVRAEERRDWGDYQISPHRRPNGRWRGTPDGYQLELRLPLATLGGAWREAELGLAVVDVDRADGPAGAASSQAMWVVPQQPGAFALQAPQARVFDRAWREASFDSQGRQLAIFDARGRELLATFTAGEKVGERVQKLLRAFAPGSGGPDGGSGGPDSGSAGPRGGVTPPSGRIAQASVGLAAAPVVSERDQLLGLLVEADALPTRPRLPASLRESPTSAAILSGALLLLFLLLAYTRRLSQRILGLVDDVGADRDADDEIGELSRRLSDLIERDRAHRDYLEQLPRVLAHETSNPLAVVRMFIDELDAQQRSEQQPHRHAARRALLSIEDLIEDLREATSLEEALERGERVEVELIEHLQQYASAYRDLNRVDLEIELPERSFHSVVIEGRIEQLLDKLLDNACDFSDGEPVKLVLETSEAVARIRVENTGPPLPEGPAAEQLFAPMRSGRKRTRERHLGLGLFVARVIAEHHAGELRAWNEAGGRVAFEFTLAGSGR